MVDLHLTIPNSNKRVLLRESLEALPAAASAIELDITVVDNMSTDGSADMVERDFPDVTLIRRSCMHGSSANFNVGMRSASARYIGILHEDARPLSGSLDDLVRFLDSHPRAGGVSPLIRFPDGSLDRTAGRFPAVHDNLLRQLMVVRRLSQYRQYREEVSTPITVDACSATCLIFRREALRDSGLFDENFVIFYEEIDLFRRLARDDWEAWFLPSVEVIHAGGITRPRSTRSRDEELRAAAVEHHFQRSKYLWFRKHKGYVPECIVRATDASLAILKYVVLLLALALHPKHPSTLWRRSAVHKSILHHALAHWPRRDSSLEVTLDDEVPS